MIKKGGFEEIKEKFFKPHHPKECLGGWVCYKNIVLFLLQCGSDDVRILPFNGDNTKF